MAARGRGGGRAYLRELTRLCPLGHLPFCADGRACDSRRQWNRGGRRCWVGRHGGSRGVRQELQDSALAYTRCGADARWQAPRSCCPGPSASSFARWSCCCSIAPWLANEALTRWGSGRTRWWMTRTCSTRRLPDRRTVWQPGPTACVRQDQSACWPPLLAGLESQMVLEQRDHAPPQAVTAEGAEGIVRRFWTKRANLISARENPGRSVRCVSITVADGETDAKMTWVVVAFVVAAAIIVARIFFKVRKHPQQYQAGEAGTRRSSSSCAPRDTRRSMSITWTSSWRCPMKRPVRPFARVWSQTASVSMPKPDDGKDRPAVQPACVQSRCG